MEQPVDVLALLPRLDAAAKARHHVRQWLLAWQLQDLMEPVELLTSELVTNAMLHAGTSITVSVQRDGKGVRVEVGDGSAVRPVRRRTSTTATTGRGVQMLESVSDSWGSTTVRGGKLVWFRVLSGAGWNGFVALNSRATAKL